MVGDSREALCSGPDAALEKKTDGATALSEAMASFEPFRRSFNPSHKTDRHPLGSQRSPFQFHLRGGTENRNT